MARPEDRAFVRWREAGDAEALARVYDDTAPVLLRIALHHVRHPASAEDLVQATFLAAIENARGYDAARPLLGWLVGILHNQAKWLQRREGRAADAARLDERAAPDPLAAAQGAELTAQCDAAIDALPEAYRPVLRLSLRHELSAAEIAHVLGRAPGTVRCQIARGLELLRASLPAGTALAAFAVLTPGRGLAAVRETVLAAGGAHAASAGAAAAATAQVAALARPVAAATAALAAGVTMKKIAVVVAAAALLLLGGWLALPSVAGDRTAPPVPPMSPADSSAAAATGDPGPRGGSAAPPRTAVPDGVIAWRLSGTVSDAAGPAAGASVAVGVAYEGDAEPFATVTVDAGGRYAVDLAELRAQPALDRHRAKLRLLFRAEGRAADVEVKPPHHDAQRSLDVIADATLLTAAVVIGRVVDAAGRAVAGASVSLRALDAAVDAPREHAAQATTERDGRFLLRSTRAGRAAVVAEHVASGRATASCDIELARDHALPDLVLRADAQLRGRFVFGDGEPAAGVGVLVHEPGREGQTVATTVTEVDGGFAVCTLPAGRYQVSPRCLSKNAVPKVVATTDGEPVTLSLSGLHQLRFAFEDERGRAVRPTGVSFDRWDEAHGSAAAAFAAGGELPPSLEQAPTGYGGFRSVLVARGTWMHLEASLGDARAEVMVQAAPPRNVQDVTLTLRELRRTATLRLELACADGTAPGDAKLYLHQLRLGEPGSYELDGERDGPALTVQWHPGRYRLEVRPKRTASDFGAFARFQEVVHLRDGETTVVRRTVAPGGRVRLHLHTPDARSRDAVEDLAVETPGAAGELGQRSFVRMLADGWMSLGSAPANTPLLWEPLLPPGRHVLTFRSRDFAEQQLAVIVEPRAVTDVHVWLQPR
jgi:RNA polymerase sigma-70 factor (ECF subfamily)